MKKTLKTIVSPVLDLVVSIVSMVSLPLLGIRARLGWKHFPLSRRVSDLLSVLPVKYHYFQPIYRAEKGSLTTIVPTAQGNPTSVSQDSLLSSLEEYATESDKFPIDRPASWDKQPSYYYYYYGSFGSGDAEVLYALICHLKPRRIVEVGSGFSTLVMVAAARANAREGYDRPAITCIEPYEAHWLSRVTEVELLRQPVDRVVREVFESLGDGDLLFIDSSHVIRPGDDVWFVFFKLLPSLKRGCWVHFHDIFLPKDYPPNWVEENKAFWNEQYILAAFLSFNEVCRPQLMLNAIYHEDRDSLERVCPVLKRQSNREPGSAWIQKVT